MANASIKDDLINQVIKLSPELQRKVLDFAKTLEIPLPKGVNGKSLLRFEGVIIDKDLQLISKAIEDECEKVDINEWQIPV